MLMGPPGFLLVPWGVFVKMNTLEAIEGLALLGAGILITMGLNYVAYLIAGFGIGWTIAALLDNN